MKKNQPSLKKQILTVAHREFVTKGVKETSIRTIAKEAGVSIGTLYNHFQSKDHLFREVLSPLIDAIDRYLLSHNTERNLSIEIFEQEALRSQHIAEMKQLIERFRPELRLLLFESEGTSLQEYKSRIIESQYRIAHEYLRLMKQKYPHIHIDISPLFLRIACSAWMTLFSSLVLAQEYEQEQIDQALEEYAAYTMAGWKELIKP